jgi:hypothetical protein
MSEHGQRFATPAAREHRKSSDLSVGVINLHGAVLHSVRTSIFSNIGLRGSIAHAANGGFIPYEPHF